MRRLIALVATAFVGACTLPPVAPIRTDVQPLGRHWVYRVSDSKGKELGRIESHIVAVDGNKVTQETAETLSGQTTTRRATATFQPDGSLVVDEGDGRLSPLPSVRRLLIPGARWQNPDGTQVVVEGQDTVTVPAGTYLAFRLSLTKDANKATDWYYPSVGLIKEVTAQTIVELLSVSDGRTSATPASEAVPSPGQ